MDWRLSRPCSAQNSPGPGTIYLEQDLRFRKPVSPGDTITVTVTVREKRPEKRVVVLDTRGANQHGEEVLNGSATVIAPDRAIEWPRTASRCCTGAA